MLRCSSLFETITVGEKLMVTGLRMSRELPLDPVTRERVRISAENSACDGSDRRLLNCPPGPAANHRLGKAAADRANLSIEASRRRVRPLPATLGSIELAGDD